jgi:hypothetical protein
VPWRLDDELVRRRGGLAERLRGVGQLSLQSSTFCVQKSDNEAINLSGSTSAGARQYRTAMSIPTEIPTCWRSQQVAETRGCSIVGGHPANSRLLRSQRARFQDSARLETRLERRYRANFDP